MHHNDKRLPFFQRDFGGNATNKIFIHESHYSDKVPKDQTYQFAGIIEDNDFPSRERVPNRNQRPPRGEPYSRNPLQGYNRKSVSSFSSTERLLQAQTYLDGTSKTVSLAHQGVKKDKIRERVDKEKEVIDDEINKLQLAKEHIDSKEKLAEVDEAIEKLKNNKVELEKSLNPNYEMEQGIKQLVELFKGFGKPEEEIKEGDVIDFEPTSETIFGPLNNSFGTASSDDLNAMLIPPPAPPVSPASPVSPVGPSKLDVEIGVILKSIESLSKADENLEEIVIKDIKRLKEGLDEGKITDEEYKDQLEIIKEKLEDDIKTQNKIKYEEELERQIMGYERNINFALQKLPVDANSQEIFNKYKKQLNEVSGTSEEKRDKIEKIFEELSLEINENNKRLSPTAATTKSIEDLVMDIDDEDQKNEYSEDVNNILNNVSMSGEAKVIQLEKILNRLRGGGGNADDIKSIFSTESSISESVSTFWNKVMNEEIPKPKYGDKASGEEKDAYIELITGLTKQFEDDYRNMTSDQLQNVYTKLFSEDPESLHFEKPVGASEKLRDDYRRIKKYVELGRKNEPANMPEKVIGKIKQSKGGAITKIKMKS